MTNIHSSPSSWDKKLEEKSGKPYYIHYYSCEDTSRNKTPNRILYDHLQHRSPEIKRNLIHPNNSIPIEAFTENSMEIMNKSTKSPLLKLKCAKIQDIPISTSISSANSSEESSAVTKISTMFPTVSETHIKLLLNKYLNREALVISALQVEKYPITTPGPFSTPPPQQRNIQIFNIKDSKSVNINNNNNNNNNNGQIIMKNHLHYHNSPKMKLRYMKSIFPNADETLILDCLQNNENSIQKTSENLIEMGYSKRETVKPLTPQIKPKNEDSSVEINDGKTSPKALLEETRKTINEKDQIKNNLKIQYDDVPEHLISIALESVNFNENRAKQILEIMKQEDEKLTIKVTNNEIKSELDFKTKTQIPITQSRQSLKSLLINKTEKKENSNNRFSRVLNTDDDNNNNNNNDGFKSFNLSNTLGHNAALSKGPNQKLLLENYVQWQGTNKSLSKGPQNLAKGSNKNLIFKSLYKPFGPTMELGQGALCALVKGSIFNQQKLIID